MRARAGELAPAASQRNWKDAREFFRSGGAGEWRERLGAADVAAYDARVASLVTPDLAVWVHGGRRAVGVGVGSIR
jgi:hypothetical protein